MAKFGVSGLDELMLSMAEIAELPDDVAQRMLEAQADVLIPAIKARGEGYGVEDTGLTLSSLTKSKMKQSEKIGRYISVYFKGSRVRGEKQVRNGEIAFLNEFGDRRQTARPFIKDSIEVSAETVTKAAEIVYDEFLKSKNL